MRAQRVTKQAPKKEEKKAVILPPLVSCNGCIYFEDTGRSVMYCNKIKMPSAIGLHHCIHKNTDQKK